MTPATRKRVTPFVATHSSAVDAIDDRSVAEALARRRPCGRTNAIVRRGALSALCRARGLADEMPVRQRTQVCAGRREPAECGSFTPEAVTQVRWPLRCVMGSAQAFAEAPLRCLQLTTFRLARSVSRSSAAATIWGSSLWVRCPRLANSHSDQRLKRIALGLREACITARIFRLSRSTGTCRGNVVARRSTPP
jgi:hypothetical protein